MELSYKAYNPYDDSSNLQQLLPGAFMNGETGTAWESLEQSGFSDVKIFNYDVDNAQSDNVSIIGHTVGHRNITIPNNIRNNTTNNITNNVGGSNYVSTNTRYGTHSNDVCTRTFFGLVGSDRSFLSEPVLTSDDGSDNASGRPLVVLTVRGTVTVSEWILNASEILDDVPGGFATGKDIVMSTLYGRNIDKEACPYSANHDTENDTGCSYCVGCLEAYGLNDPNNPPIILITGHSLGAAVANLTAAHLSSCNEDNCPCGNEENPQNVISEFLKVFDGEVIEARYLQSAGGETSSGMGYVYKVETWKIEVKTFQSTYLIWVTWVIADTRVPKEVGLAGMTVTDTSYNLLSEIC